jgi:hypothetical protein
LADEFVHREVKFIKKRRPSKTTSETPSEAEQLSSRKRRSQREEKEEEGDKKKKRKGSFIQNLIASLKSMPKMDRGDVIASSRQEK